MTDQPTPENIKAFLDDLARISLRHGVMIDSTRSGIRIACLDDGWLGGYDAAIYENHGGHYMNSFVAGLDIQSLNWHGDHITSIDITQLSNHERVEIIGGQFQNLARMPAGQSERYTAFDNPLHMSCCTTGIFVVDTTRPDPMREGRYEAVCECDSEAEAMKIADAMNFAEYAAKIIGGRA